MSVEREKRSVDVGAICPLREKNTSADGPGFTRRILARLNMLVIVWGVS